MTAHAVNTRKSFEKLLIWDLSGVEAEPSANSLSHLDLCVDQRLHRALAAEDLDETCIPPVREQLGR